jgi:methylase of polypeptide subunit release factors
MTPLPVARFMASLFPAPTLHTLRLLDAGAGVGALSCAFIDRCASHGDFKSKALEVQAFEIDDTLRARLEIALADYGARIPVRYEIFSGDFISIAARKTLLGLRPFSHAILNPPYKKINGDSEHRRVLRRAGLETVNLYSAFVGLSLMLLQPGGQLVAIIPRSFCNGPYYRPFREFLFSNAALVHVHLFASRSRAFREDDVLQENIIILLERGGNQGTVTVSTSTDESLADFKSCHYPFDRIVFPQDPEKFIHVPTSPGYNHIEVSPAIRSTLADLDLTVSTGPVVDFRLLKHIHQIPDEMTAPLLYPGHFIGNTIQWPKKSMKRGNAIKINEETKRWLYPNGFYTITRRFSAKEERRRIVASVVTPATFPDATMLGFENHLNVFHEQRHGLPENLARGLAAFLNTTAVDDYFRRFNGHTQVNATDLRLINYPNRFELIALGKWAKSQNHLTQALLDERFEKLAE